MTASIIRNRPATVGRPSLPAGLGALVRKDTTEWLRGRRAWVVLAVSVMFMVLSAASNWITARIVELSPPGVQVPDGPISLLPLDNLIHAFASQIFVLAAVFAVASLIAQERESGTLAWVASKPVSRDAIWVSKWISASGILVVTAVLAPLALTALAVGVLYGLPSAGAVAVLAVGGAATIAFYVAVGLTVATVVPGQPAVAAAGFGVFVLVPLIGSLVGPIAPLLPTSILPWSIGLAVGADVGFATPIAWAVVTGALVIVSLRRIRRFEL